jgi:hypothetical protein
MERVVWRVTGQDQVTTSLGLPGSLSAFEHGDGYGPGVLSFDY